MNLEEVKEKLRYTMEYRLEQAVAAHKWSQNTRISTLGAENQCRNGWYSLFEWAMAKDALDIIERGENLIEALEWKAKFDAREKSNPPVLIFEGTK